MPALAEDCSCPEETVAIEHMFNEKGSLTNKVTITNLRNIICKGNVFKVAFVCKLHSDKVIAGETVNFCVPEAIYTQEGTLLIPAGSKVAGKIIKIQKPKIFNKNARVYIKFECLILPNGTAIVMNGRPNTCDGALKEGAWMTAGKLTASTLGLGIIGAASAPACVVREEIRKCKELTDKPFDVNIMLLNPKTDEAWRQHLCLAHRQYRWEPGLWLRKNPLCTPIINKKSLRLRISIPQLQKRQIHFYDLTAATISAVVFGLFME